MRLFYNRSLGRARKFRRSLYTKADSTRQGSRYEVVIGNNTAIFSTLASMEMHQEKEHENLYFICPSFWLDKVHEDHMHLDWGQNMYGLPWYARRLLKELYPKYPVTQPLTWRMYQDLRLYAINKLKERCEGFYRGEPFIEKIHGNVVISNLTKSETSPYFKRLDLDTDDTFFYNWYRDQKPHTLGPYVIQRPLTHLYRLPTGELPNKVVVLGQELSVVSVKKHFPSIQVATIRKRGDFLPKIQSNQEVNYAELHANTYFVDDIELRAHSSNSLVKITSKRERGRHFIGEFYNAIGLIPRGEITSDISADRQMRIPGYYSPAIWKAPENVAFGSLAENYVGWMKLTHNLKWAFEPMAYHNSTVPEIIRDYVRERTEIDLSLDFFDLLERKFVSCYSSYTNDTLIKDSISDNDYIDLFEQTFVEFYKNVYPKSQLTELSYALNSLIRGRRYATIDDTQTRNFSFIFPENIYRGMHTFTEKPAHLRKDKNEKEDEKENRDCPFSSRPDLDYEAMLRNLDVKEAGDTDLELEITRLRKRFNHVNDHQTLFSQPSASNEDVGFVHNISEKKLTHTLNLASSLSMNYTGELEHSVEFPHKVAIEDLEDDLKENQWLLKSSSLY